MFKFIKNGTKDIRIGRQEAFIRKKKVTICNEFLGSEPADPRKRRGKPHCIPKAPTNLERKGDE